MEPTDRRVESRKKVAMSATIRSLNGYTRLRCAIRDATSEGCKLISTHVDELPDAIQIALDGIEEPINGKIVWRDRPMAGVRFEWPEPEPEPEEAPDLLELGAEQAVD